MANLTQHPTTPRVRSRLEFTVREVKEALKDFAESNSIVFNCSIADLNVHFPVDKEAGGEMKVVLTVVADGNEPKITEV